MIVTILIVVPIFLVALLCIIAIMKWATKCNHRNCNWDKPTEEQITDSYSRKVVYTLFIFKGTCNKCGQPVVKKEEVYW